MKEKLKIIKAILVGIITRSSMLGGVLCEEEKLLGMYSDGDESKKDRKKALAKLVLLEKDLKANIQKYRDCNERIKDWQDYEIGYLAVYVSNIFSNASRSFSDSQEFRTLNGDHLEDYLALHESLKSGNLSKLFQVQFCRCYYNYELQKDVTL